MGAQVIGAPPQPKERLPPPPSRLAGRRADIRERSCRPDCTVGHIGRLELWSRAPGNVLRCRTAVTDGRRAQHGRACGSGLAGISIACGSVRDIVDLSARKFLRRGFDPCGGGNNPRRLICQWLIGLRLHRSAEYDRGLATACYAQCLDCAPQPCINRMPGNPQLAGDFLGGRVVVDKVEAFTLPGAQARYAPRQVNIRKLSRTQCLHLLIARALDAP